MVKKIVEALVEFFGSLLGVPSVINRPLHQSQFTPKQKALDAFQDAPPVDLKRLRDDIDGPLRDDIDR
jgi:hypothetical protein